MKAKMILVLAFISMLAVKVNSQADGEIRGIVKNKDLEPVSYAIVRILQGNLLISGAQTDENGRYSCKPLTPGKYELIVQHPEYQTLTIRQIQVNASEAAYVDPKLLSNDLGTVTVQAKAIDYTQTGVDVNVFHTVSLDRTEINNNSSYDRGNVKGALEFMTSETVKGSDGEYHIRGARAGASGYFVDGVRVLSLATIPGGAIENISAFTGGVPAMYGDLTSGAVMITTRSYFTGMRDKNIRLTKWRVEKEEEAARKKSGEDEARRRDEIEKEEKEK